MPGAYGVHPATRPHHRISITLYPSNPKPGVESVLRIGEIISSPSCGYVRVLFDSQPCHHPSLAGTSHRTPVPQADHRTVAPVACLLFSPLHPHPSSRITGHLLACHPFHARYCRKPRIQLYVSRWQSYYSRQRAPTVDNRPSGYLLGSHRHDDMRLAKHPNMGHQQPVIVEDLGIANQLGVCRSRPAETEENRRGRRDKEAHREKVGLGHRGKSVHASRSVLVCRDGMDRGLEERSRRLLRFQGLSYGIRCALSLQLMSHAIRFYLFNGAAQVPNAQRMVAGISNMAAQEIRHI